MLHTVLDLQHTSNNMIIGAITAIVKTVIESNLHERKGRRGKRRKPLQWLKELSM